MGCWVVEELERSIVCILEANEREKRRFFFDKDKMEKDQIWYSGSKAQKHRVELLSSMYEGHENNAMLVNIRTGAKQN